MFCGCCRVWEDKEPTARTPLLGEDPSKPVIRQPVRPAATSSTQVTDEVEDIGPGKLGKIVVKPTKVSHVDKRLQDHSRLFNDHYEKYLDIQAYKQELQAAFVGEGGKNHSLKTTFSLMKERANCSLDLQQKHKYCLKIQYDDRHISGEVLPVVRTFNKANKLIKEVLDKGPGVRKSVQLVLQDERELRRDVLASSLGLDGPQCMKNCLSGIAHLRRVPGFIEEMESETKSIYRELVKASEVLMDGRGGKEGDINENVRT